MTNETSNVTFIPERGSSVNRATERISEVPEQETSSNLGNEQHDTRHEPIIVTHKSASVGLYQQVVDDANAGCSGEELMRKYHLKRRVQLKALMYDACSHLGVQTVPIKFETDACNGEKPLHPIKIAKDGSLRISSQQLRRKAKLELQVGTEFIIQPLPEEKKGFILRVT